MPRGTLEVHIQAISAAYHYTHEKKIKDFCKCLRGTVDRSQKRMSWHPGTNERHRNALEALEGVADKLRKIREEVKSTSNDPDVVKMQMLKQMDKYLVCRLLGAQNLRWHQID